MLDGLVIKGNEPAHAPTPVAAISPDSQQRHYLSIVISVLAHLLLVALLLYFAQEKQIKLAAPVDKAIKSYLYHAPKKKLEQKPTIETEKAKSSPQVIEPNSVKAITTELKKVAGNQQEKPKKLSLPSVDTAQNKAIIHQSKQAKFSAYKQLNRLRNRIADKVMTEELTKLQQFRSPSIMHAQQATVPHSKATLSPEQVRRKNTVKMSNDIAITKHDNGTCTIERSQFLGSPVEGSSSVFACGESKFDKNFRQHMKKVQKKLMSQGVTK